MRRKDREISRTEALELLGRCEYGVLATAAENLPYATPLSYVLLGETVYFHSAREGHKVDNMRGNSRCCFVVVGETRPVYDNNFTTCYESAVVFGAVREVTEPDEKHAALSGLARKYLPEHMDKAERSIRASQARTAVYALQIDVLSGKAKRGK